MNDLSIDDISDMIVDSVLSETYLNKENLKVKICSILKIWIKKQNNFKPRKTADVNKLLWTIQKEKLEARFWYEKVKQLIPKEELEDLYKEQKFILLSEGLDKYSPDGN